jgi:anti-sigma factor RsiW
MNLEEREPSPDQLLAMAYADGELPTETRLAFEARLAREPELVREVAEHLRLDVLARRAAGPEPADFEWKRLATETLQRGGLGAGWTLLIGGAAALFVWAALTVARSELDLAAKLALAAVGLGVVLVGTFTVRARLRTMHLDPYRDLER